MKTLYLVLFIVSIIAVSGCYEARVATVVDRDGIEKPIKTVLAGSRISTSRLVYSGRKDNMIYFDLENGSILAGQEPSGSIGYTRHYEYDLAKSDTVGFLRYSFRVIGANKNKMMFIDYTKYSKRR